MSAGGEANRFAEALAGREFLAVRAAELDACDEAALADFMDERVAGFQICETAGEAGDFFRQVGEGLFLGKNIEAGEGGGAA